MPKGQRIKPEQIVMLLRQIEVLTANGKTLAQACKEIGVGEQNYYRWPKMYDSIEIVYPSLMKSNLVRVISCCMKLRSSILNCLHFLM